jgi:hypothetical protein
MKVYYYYKMNMPLRNSKVKVILPDGNSVEYQTDKNGYILADFNVAGRYYNRLFRH